MVPWVLLLHEKGSTRSERVKQGSKYAHTRSSCVDLSVNRKVFGRERVSCSFDRKVYVLKRLRITLLKLKYQIALQVLLLRAPFCYENRRRLDGASEKKRRKKNGRNALRTRFAKSFAEFRESKNFRGNLTRLVI